MERKNNSKLAAKDRKELKEKQNMHSFIDLCALCALLRLKGFN